MELTTLIIPTVNDSPQLMEKEAEWIASLSPDIALHLSRFFPRYKWNDFPITSAETIFELRDIAKKHLRHVYCGNL